VISRELAIPPAAEEDPAAFGRKSSQHQASTSKAAVNEGVAAPAGSRNDRAIKIQKKFERRVTLNNVLALHDRMNGEAPEPAATPRGQRRRLGPFLQDSVCLFRKERGGAWPRSSFHFFSEKCSLPQLFAFNIWCSSRIVRLSKCIAGVTRSRVLV